MVTYAVAALLIRSLIEGAKTAFPAYVTKIVAQIAAVALSALAVYAYGLNALAEVGLKSNFPLFDQAASVLVLALIAMIEHDILKQQS